MDLDFGGAVVALVTDRKRRDGLELGKRSFFRIERQGGTIAYTDQGTGPAILLIHGLGDTARTWRALTPRLVQAGYNLADVKSGVLYLRRGVELALEPAATLSQLI